MAIEATGRCARHDEYDKDCGACRVQITATQCVADSATLAPHPEIRAENESTTE